METKILKNEKGVSLVLLALAVVVIFGFGALAIDIGHLYNVKNQLQVAADAAALAGAAKLVGDNDLTQTNARNEAQRIAALNVADVAYDAVPGFGQSPGAAEGQPIPVSLQLPQDAEDIIVGNWDGAIFTPSGVPVNAVKVVAKRTGNVGVGQPQVQNWFARIFNIPRHLGVDYGNNFNLANVSAVAIAAKEKLPLLPIAVNEYWDEATDNSGNPANSSGGAYGQAIQRYPQSFMRETNADGTTSQMGGRTFAIMGANANSNNASFNLNSFVDILYRNRLHTPVAESLLLSDFGGTVGWFEVLEGASTGSCSSGCISNLDPVTAVAGSGGTYQGVKNGDVEPSKFEQNFGYLFRGIPDSIIPPNAVREKIRVTPAYTFDNYNNTTSFNDPSNCPFASIPYYAGSGVTSVVKKLDAEGDDFDGQNFWQRWPEGSQFMVMVYDGTLTTNPDPNQANVITIVGYGIIEIDGYQNNPFNGDRDTLRVRGGTAYGHAIPHGLTGVNSAIADVSDPLIIQPPDTPANATTSSARKGSCSFTDIIRQAQNNFANVRLVDPSLHYGLHQQ